MIGIFGQHFFYLVKTNLKKCFLPLFTQNDIAKDYVNMLEEMKDQQTFELQQFQQYLQRFILEGKQNKLELFFFFFAIVIFFLRDFDYFSSKILRPGRAGLRS